MQQYDEKIRELTKGIIANEGIDLIHVDCLQMKSRWLVRLFIDKESGITVEDCALVSGIVGDILDVNDVPTGTYTLEVSSPGEDRPISREEDFIRFVGEMVTIKLKQPINGSKNIKGYLKEFSAVEEGGQIVVENDKGLFVVPLAYMIRANLHR